MAPKWVDEVLFEVKVRVIQKHDDSRKTSVQTFYSEPGT